MHLPGYRFDPVICPRDNIPVYSFILNKIILSLKVMLSNKFILGH